MLSLKEMLVQTVQGSMTGHVLVQWLAKVQTEFLRRMAEIDGDDTVVEEAEEAGA